MVVAVRVNPGLGLGVRVSPNPIYVGGGCAFLCIYVGVWVSGGPEMVVAVRVNPGLGLG